MNLSFSYSLLNTFYSVCPEQCRRVYVLRDIKKTYTVESEGGIDAHKELERRIKQKTPLPAPLADAEKHVAALERMGEPQAEVSYGVTHLIKPIGFWHAWFRGKFDVVILWQEKARAFIGDWKTGKVRETAEQLEIGALLLMENHPAIDEVTGANIWLAKNQIGTPYKFTRLPSEADPVGRSKRWAKLIQRARAIEAMKPQEEWEKREGPLCAYCPVKECQHNRSGK